jgi:hypothetical protein
MAKTPTPKGNSAIGQAIERILNTDRMSRKEHVQLTSAILSNKNLSKDMLYQINLIFERIQLGQITMID